MRIQIDTEQKEIRLPDQVRFDDLIDKLNMLFPDGSWKEYYLVIDNTITWIQPVLPIVQPFTPPWYPNRPEPWTPPLPILYGTGGDGVFNISI